jgi:hypothetical protein
MENIKLELNTISTEGKEEIKLFTIRVNKVIDDSVMGIGWVKKKYKMSFSITIPEHIHEIIKGNSVFYSNEGRITYPNNFPKTISDESLEGLCNKHWDIIRSCKWLIERKEAALEKVIFYSITPLHLQETKSRWNGVELGSEINFKYSWFVGYISSDKLFRYNIHQQLLSKTNDQYFYGFNFVKWTEEEEAKFNKTNEHLINSIKMEWLFGGDL